MHLAHLLIALTLVVLMEVTNAYWLQKGVDLDGEAIGDQSGYSVALSEDGLSLAIGSPYGDSSGNDRGIARVYQWSGTAWSQVGSDIVPGQPNDYCGSSVALNGDGTIVAIGAFNGGGGSNTGAVSVYTWTTSWNSLGSQLLGSTAGDKFGWAVALNRAGTLLAVGAPLNSAAGALGSNRGIAKVYQYSSGSWSQYGSTLNGAADNEQFGMSVALNSVGSILAVGAPLASSSRGFVKVYEYSSGWSQRGSTLNGETNGDRSGWSISMNGTGTLVAIGAPYNSGNGGNSSGQVRVHYWNGGSWGLRGTDIDGETANDMFGYSVSLSVDGRSLIAGAPFSDGDDNTDSKRGSVQVYGWSGSGWVQKGNDIYGEIAGDNFGNAVTINRDGSIIAIGAPLNTGPDSSNTSPRGSVRAFDNVGDPTSQPSRQPSGQPTRQPTGQPSRQPTGQPTRQPSYQPTTQPSRQPSGQPTGQPSQQPTGQPTVQPSSQPAMKPSGQPTMQPSGQPTRQPTRQPTSQPVSRPTCQPTQQPTSQPTSQPSMQPTSQPTCQPSLQPSRQPTKQPSSHPSSQPSSQPSRQPSGQPTIQPTLQPTSHPSTQPSAQPSVQPSCQPSSQPSSQPSVQPSTQPSVQPSSQPSSQPTGQPSSQPTCQPSAQPSMQPSCQPSSQPNSQPSVQPSGQPSGQPTFQPSIQPSSQPIPQPSMQPSGQPSVQPSG
ncbi:hypothetical protein EON65_28140, partial [archaeon]